VREREWVRGEREERVSERKREKERAGTRARVEAVTFAIGNL
jgi:hypothetical protein